MKFLHCIYILLLVFSCTNNKRQVITEQAMKIVGGVYLPDSLEPIEILEDWLPNGDGYLIHRYSIDGPLYNNVFNQLKDEGIKNLPFDDNDFIDNLIYDFVNDSDLGIYKLINDEEDIRDIMLIVLDSTKMELIIMHSRQ